MVTFAITKSHCTFSDGAVNTSVSGGTPGYTFSWDIVADITKDLTGKPAGNYTLTTTDNNTCTNISVASISDEDGPSVSIASSINPSCPGSCNGSVSISVNGGVAPYLYDWSNDSTTQNISDLCAGIYSIEVTDDSSCVGTNSVTLVDPTPLSIIFDKTNVTCFNACDGIVSALVSGGEAPYTYDWSNGLNSFNIGGLCAGTYTVTVHDAKACELIASVTITQPNPISVVPVITDAKCNGESSGEINLTITGGTPNYTTNWSDAQTTNPAINLSAGSYDVTVIDVNSCDTTLTVIVSQPSAIVLDLTIVDANCGQSNGSAEVLPSGGSGVFTDFIWSNGPTTALNDGIPAGAYGVTVTDNVGCEQKTTANVGNIGGPTISLVTLKHPTCNGDCDGEITISATGGTGAISYLWTNNDTTATTDTLCDGTYSVFATDENNCSDVESYVIDQPDAISIAFITTNPNCNGSCDGTATAIVTGGNGSYSYAWSVAGNTAKIEKLCDDVYTLTASDVKLCTGNSSLTITDPAILNTTVISKTDVNCNGECDGEILTTSVGGTTPYTFLWSNSQITENAFVDSPGIVSK